MTAEFKKLLKTKLVIKQHIENNRSYLFSKQRVRNFYEHTYLLNFLIFNQFI